MGKDVAGVVALALRVVVGALVALTIAASVQEATWLGGRAWWLAGLAAGALGAAWWPWGRRYESGWAAGWALTACVVAGTALGRIAPGEPVPGREGLAVMTDRVLDRDLPPSGVYAAVLASASVVVIGVVLTLPWRTRVTKPSRPAVGVGLVGGVVIGAVLVASVHGGATWVRGVVDRRADADAVTATTTRPVERVEVAGGPAVPTEIAWQFLPSRSDHESVEGMVVVPGWDAVVVTSSIYDDDDDPAGAQVQVLSKHDRTVLWRYRRHDGGISGVSVDPDRGRVLVLADGAAIVLDLASGTEIDARPLPDSLVHGTFVDGDFGSSVRPTAKVTVGSWAVIEQPRPSVTRSDGPREPMLGVLNVANGEVVATTPMTSSSCDYAASTTAASPVIVQWTSDVECGGPQVLRLDGSRLRASDVVLAGGGDEDEAARCRLRCAGERMIVTDDVIVLSIRDEAFGRGDVIALSPDGELLWRASETVEAPAAMDGGGFVVAVTGRHVVAWWGDAWHLLSLTDGAEQTRAAQCGGPFAFATDGERLYTACHDPDRTLVLRLEDLALLSDDEPAVGRWDLAFANDGYLVTAALGGDGVVALGSQPR